MIVDLFADAGLGKDNFVSELGAVKVVVLFIVFKSISPNFSRGVDCDGSIVFAFHDTITVFDLVV